MANSKSKCGDPGWLGYFVYFAASQQERQKGVDGEPAVGSSRGINA